MTNVYTFPLPSDAPPLPAPNVKKRPPPPVRGQTSHTLDRSSRPPPLKPRSVSIDDSSPPDIPPKPGPKSVRSEGMS